jgi:hypothetical protein
VHNTALETVRTTRAELRTVSMQNPARVRIDASGAAFCMLGRLAGTV